MKGHEVIRQHRNRYLQTKIGISITVFFVSIGFRSRVAQLYCSGFSYLRITPMYWETHWRWLKEKERRRVVRLNDGWNIRNAMTSSSSSTLNGHHACTRQTVCVDWIGSFNSRSIRIQHGDVNITLTLSLQFHKLSTVHSVVTLSCAWRAAPRRRLNVKMWCSIGDVLGFIEEVTYYIMLCMGRQQDDAKVCVHYGSLLHGGFQHGVGNG